MAQLTYGVIRGEREFNAYCERRWKERPCFCENFARIGSEVYIHKIEAKAPTDDYWTKYFLLVLPNQYGRFFVPGIREIYEGIGNGTYFGKFPCDLFVTFKNNAVSLQQLQQTITYNTPAQEDKVGTKIMTKVINNYSYTNVVGMQIHIRTEKYGVCGFEVYVSIPRLGLEDVRSNLFKNQKGEWLINVGFVNGRNTLVKPATEVLMAILADKNTPTEERKQYDDAERERKQKERAWDNLYNEGTEGYNPYRREKQGLRDNTPYYKGDYTE